MSTSHLDSLGLEQLEPVGVVERLEVRAQVVTALEVDGAQVAPEGRLASVRPLVHRKVTPTLEHPENKKQFFRMSKCENSSQSEGYHQANKFITHFIANRNEILSKFA